VKIIFFAPNADTCIATRVDLCMRTYKKDIQGYTNVQPYIS